MATLSYGDGSGERLESDSKLHRGKVEQWLPTGVLLIHCLLTFHNHTHLSVYRNTKLAKIALLADTLLTKLTLAILCIRPDGVLKHLFIYHL